MDVATGGPANQRFGVDGATAFTPTLYDNEEAIARVLKPGVEVTCLGALDRGVGRDALPSAAWPTQELRLRVLRDRATPALDGDPEYRRLRAAGRIVEEVGRPIWVYAESAGNVRLRITGKECQSQEKTVPLAINTRAWRSASGGYSDQRNDCERLAEAEFGTKSDRCRCEVCNRYGRGSLRVGRGSHSE